MGNRVQLEMGRIPCCEKDSAERGQWTPEEDSKLAAYIALHGTENRRLIPKNAGMHSENKTFLSPGTIPSSKSSWDSIGTSAGNFHDCFPEAAPGFQFGGMPFGNEGHGSPWNQSMCTGSTCTAGDQQGRLHDKLDDEIEEEPAGGRHIWNTASAMFKHTDCILWDLPSADLMNPTV